MYGRTIECVSDINTDQFDIQTYELRQLTIGELERLAYGCYAIVSIHGNSDAIQLCESDAPRKRIIILAQAEAPASLIAPIVQSGFTHIITAESQIRQVIRDSMAQQYIPEESSVYDNLLAQRNIYKWSYCTQSKLLRVNKALSEEFGIESTLGITDLEEKLVPCIYPGDLFMAKRLAGNISEQNAVNVTSIRLLNRFKEMGWYRFSVFFQPKSMIYYGIIQNIHAEKNNEEKIILEAVRYNKIKDQLQKLQKSAKVGVWKFHREQMKFTWEDATAQILGFPAHTIMSLNEMESAVYSDDRIMFRKSIQALLHQQTDSPFEFRISTSKHPLLYIRMQAVSSSRLMEHNAAIIEGTLQDVSALKIYSLELEAKNLQLQSINQNMVSHTADIETARKKAEESDKLKTSFLSNISHEVRTPISSIGGFAELLRSESITKEQRERYIGLILQSNKQLLQIFTDVLELSKINSNQLELNISPVNVNYTLREIRDEYQPLLQAKRLQMQVDLPYDDSACVILSDWNKIHRILSSIIDNALKFTETGSIRLSYAFHAGKLSVQVQDTGIGIPEEKLKYIFQPFRQGDETLGRGYGGIGLGLSIVDGLVKLFNGDISIKSKIGIGTTVRFTMPVAQAEPEELCLVSNEVKCDWSDKTLLIIEDNDINFSFFKELLIQSKVKILHTKTVHESKHILSDHQDITAIILDYSLPDGNGGDILSFMHTEELYRPTLIVTANNVDSVRQRCSDMIYGDILAKPFSKNVFLSKVEAMLLGKA